MYQSLLSVLFLGMIPASGPSILSSGVPQLAIAPPAAHIQVAGRLSASGVVIIDGQTGQQLYGKDASAPRPMASLTKLMTALLIVENHELNELVTIQPQAVQVEGSRAYLPAGEQFTVGDLLSALLLPSANDAAEALALHHSGTVGAFVEEMNGRAASLGLRSTSFANPTGLDNAHQWSTPQDIAWLMESVVRFPAIEQRMSKRAARIRSTEGTVIDLSHTHALLHAESPVIAGKTGTTSAAGQCLVSLVEEHGKRYTVVLLNSLQRYTDMQTILASIEPPAAISSETEKEAIVGHGG